MNGVLIVDKPAGMTSHDVVRRLRRLCQTRRVGHSGTLDPMATGLLLVAVGEGTRVVQFLVEGDKTYQATLLFGTETTTQDAEGEVTHQRPTDHLKDFAVLQACQQMVGELQQIPPMYSAIKIKGVALHRLARQGIEIERPPRPVHIKRITVNGLALPQLSFEVECSKGTYIRTLCHDLGHKLETAAHLSSLRRIRSGSFDIKEAVTLDWLEQASSNDISERFLSLASALRDYPACEVNEVGCEKLRHGIPPQISHLDATVDFEEGQKVLLTINGQALAMARFAPSRIKEKRGDFELLRVFTGGE